MPEDGIDWIALVVTAATAQSPIRTAIAEELEQQLRKSMAERELTRGEQVQLASHLISLIRNSSTAGADDED